MKKLLALLITALLALSLSSCGQTDITEYNSISDFFDAHRYTSLRDEEHPENFFRELSNLLPLDKEIYAEWNHDEEYNVLGDCYETEDRLLTGKAEITLYVDDVHDTQIASIDIDLNGSEFSEAYFICEKISENIKDAKIEIDGKEAHIAPLEQIYNDFDYTKSFSISWGEGDITKEPSFYYSVRYSYAQYGSREYVRFNVWVSRTESLV